MGGCEKWKVVVSMRRTSLVLAVVAAMVTVLVFAAPAFAANDNACPDFGSLEKECPPGTPEGPSAGKAEGIEEGVDEGPDQVDPCVGDLATDTVFHTIGEGGPPGEHVLEVAGTPGELVQQTQD